MHLTVIHMIAHGVGLGDMGVHDALITFDRKGEIFARELLGKSPLFACVIGTTNTAKIRNISAAGKNPEFTDYTPPADVELLLLGSCKCIPEVPVTPEGIPTPALITRSMLKLSNIPTIVVNSGVKVKPSVPFVELGGTPGEDIRTGKAVQNVDGVLERAKGLGTELSKSTEYLVVGESIPGGTTTALGVLLAMGVNAQGKVSSSMPDNPHELKLRAVRDGLKAAGVTPRLFG